MGGHYLKGNLNTTVPSSHLVLDVLTEEVPDSRQGNRWERQLQLWSARAFRYYGGDTTRLSARQSPHAREFWGWLSDRLDPCRVLWVWCHKAGDAMTALGLWGQMDTGRWLLNEPQWRFERRVAKNPRAKQRRGFIADSDPPVIIHLWHHGGSQMRIVDIRNWYPESLDELAERCGMLLEHNPRHATALYPEREKTSDRLQVLCHTVTGLLSTIHRHDMGVMQPTAASQAMQCYRHRFRQANLLVHDDQDARSLERKCYYGGQVEPFFVGLIRRVDAPCPLAAPALSEGGVLATPGPIYHLDVSSLYPWVMKTKPMPVRLHRSSQGPVDVGTMTMDVAMRCVADCTVKSLGLALPRREGEQTVYATGHFRTQLCGPELAAALAAGTIETIHMAYSYDMEVAFEKYVDYWWQVRLEAREHADPHTDALAKIMLNSLYGKFGQRLKRWLTILGVAPRQRWGSYAEMLPVSILPRECHRACQGMKECNCEPNERLPTLCRGFAGVLQVRAECEDLRHSIPAISAFITAHGRRRMSELRETAGRSAVYYQATDSLFVSVEGYRRLCAGGEVSPQTCGKLRVVGQADYLRIWGVNDYQFGDEVVRSGVHVSRIDPQSGRELQERSHSLRYYTEDGPKAIPASWEEPVTDRDSLPRGVLQPDGWVTPYHREEIEAPCPL